MEKIDQLTKEENDKIYIEGSKKTINNFIYNNEYRKAFGFFIIVIERLDDDQKNEFINYYSRNMKQLGFFNKAF